MVNLSIILAASMIILLIAWDPSLETNPFGRGGMDPWAAFKPIGSMQAHIVAIIAIAALAMWLTRETRR
jgi:hypothetical protein